MIKIFEGTCDYNKNFKILVISKDIKEAENCLENYGYDKEDIKLKEIGEYNYIYSNLFQ